MAVATRTVNVVATPDTTAPVITILGANPATVTVGGSYVDAGATANDAVDGNVNASITTVSTVNAAVIGTYTVVYTANDSSGNFASSTRTVNVVAAATTTPVTSYGGSSSYIPTPTVTDTVRPVITVLGANPATVVNGSSYSDAGATANDNVDGSITAKIVTINRVDIFTTGSYTVTYMVSDNAGNTTNATRIVNVVDATTPAPATSTQPVTPVTPGTPAGNPVTNGTTGSTVVDNSGNGITVPNGVGHVNGSGTTSNEVLNSSSTASTTLVGVKGTGFVATVLESFMNLSKKTLAGISLILIAIAFVGFLLYKREDEEEVSDVQY
jgi:hypothetical protein